MVVLIFGLLGLALSYFIFSSPAWAADYGFAFIPADIKDLKTPEQLQGLIIDKAQPFAGFVIEAVRLLIIGVIFSVLAGFIFNNTNVGLRGVPEPFSERWYRSPETRLLWCLLAILLLLLLLFNLSTAPKNLRKHSKYWSKLWDVQQLWEETPSPLDKNYWKNRYTEVSRAFDGKTPAFKSVNFGPELRAALYRRPYAGYLLYAIATSLLFAAPALVISLRALRHSTVGVFSEISLVSNLKRQRADAQAVLHALADVPKLILEDFDRYSWCLISVAFVAWFEAKWGCRTLSTLAIAWTKFGLIVFVLTVGLPTLSLLYYDDVARAVRRSYDEVGQREAPAAFELLMTSKGLKSIGKIAVSAIFTFIAMSVPPLL
jgi:hypothetical protein